MNELQARKRALLAESEVYRQKLALEIQQVRHYSDGLKQRFTALRSHPLFSLAPMASPWVTPLLFRARDRILFGKKPFGWRRMLLRAWTAWRLYRQLSPILTPLLGNLLGKHRTPPQYAPEESQFYTEARK